MIDLYTASTPNGWKASIVLEELAIPYQVKPIRLDKLEQKSPEFLKLNPNGRIPCIVDRANGDFAVFESGAILIYLAEQAGRLLPTDVKGRSVVIQWVMFQMGGIGPMQGQANVFLRYAPEKIEYAIQRYQKETLRLYQVLDTRLQNREYLADEYSIADIANWTWVSCHEWAGLSLEEMPNLKRWAETLAKRPACIKGISIPEKIDLDTESEKLKESGSKILV